VVTFDGLVARAAVALAIGCVAAASGAQARSLAHVTDDGIELYAAPPPKGATFDVPIMNDQDGLAALRKAVDTLIDGSHFAAQAIDKLKAAGRVVLVYDPAFPKERVTEFEVAAFYPHFFRPDEGGGRDFLVVVSRHGIKWPTRELAAVLAHELAGHGIQRLRGDFESMREIDRECEARLYQERAIQDLHVNKGASLVVQFRRSLETEYCADFKHFQATRQPVTLKLWDTRNPNVPRLLAVFRDYLAARQARAEPAAR
jgi:hypothetical protein